jgi:hypothetical protein
MIRGFRGMDVPHEIPTTRREFDMTTFTIKGTVPNPGAPRSTVFDFEKGTGPTKNDYEGGEPGREVKITTDSPGVANQLQTVWENLFENVTVEET